MRVDSIPPLEQPNMIAPTDVDYVGADEAVFGIALNGEAHAYPLRILDWHEMANITVGGVPISLAYCTLCGAAIAYDGRAPDGATYTFGTSGFLFRSNKLMYDRNTRSLWNQFTGEPVLGPLVGATGRDGAPLRLELLPIVLATYEDWLERHPDTLVLDIHTGYDRPYDPGAAYGHYFSDSETMFPVWLRSDELYLKQYVYGLRLGGARKAYPIDVLAEERVVNDTLGGRPVVLVTAKEIDTLGYGRGVGPVLYPSGGEVRAFERGDRRFYPAPDGGAVVDATGAPWEVTEDALIGTSGERPPPRQRPPRLLVRLVRLLPGDRAVRGGRVAFRHPSRGHARLALAAARCRASQRRAAVLPPLRHSSESWNPVRAARDGAEGPVPARTRQWRPPPPPATMAAQWGRRMHGLSDERYQPERGRLASREERGAVVVRFGPPARAACAGFA